MAEKKQPQEDKNLDFLAIMLDQIIEPLLSNMSIQPDFPRVMGQDLMQHVHTFQNRVHVLLGLVKGKTHLPVPWELRQIAKDFRQGEKRVHKVDESLIYSMETLVVDWTKQVYNVLNKDFSEQLLEDQNATPNAERDRLADLQGIQQQLQSPEVKVLEEILLMVKSSYYPAFAKMIQDVVEACDESKDISVYLKPLEKLIDDLEKADFSEVEEKIPPLMHTVCLIWANSKYYSKPARVAGLLRKICNLLIQQARSFLNPEDILKGDVLESRSRVIVAVDTLMHFKSTFEDRRANLSQYQRNESPVKPWDFSPLMVFVDLDPFLKRLRTVQSVLETVVGMKKLENLVVGGIRGKSLNQMIQHLHQDFFEQYKSLSEKPYDCLDVSNLEFESDCTEFQVIVDDTNRRLGTIFCRAFDDASNLEHSFKVVKMFGKLLQQPLIAVDAQTRYPVLIRMFDQELKCCNAIFKSEMRMKDTLGYSPVFKIKPPVSGGLLFVRELQDRIQSSFNELRLIDHPCMESVDAKETFRKYHEFMEQLKRCGNVTP